MRIKITDIEYLNDLRAVANRLGKHCLKQRDYSKKNGAKYSLNSAIKRFGDWNTLLKEAGLEGERSLKGMEYGEKQIKDEVLIADLIRVAKELNKPNLTSDEYTKHGKFTSVTMGVRFGSWNKAKEKANLEVSNVINNSTEELFQNILDLWTLLGRQPKYGEVVAPLSKFHGATYGRRFGSNAQNYIEIFYTDNGQLKSKLIRYSLKKIQEDFDFLVQIHRSHLINPSHFKYWKNPNTIFLTQIELPVSKNYKEQLLSL